MSQGGALGKKWEEMVEQGGLATLPVRMAELRRGRSRSELGNVALPALDSGNGGDVEVEEALTTLLAGWLGRRWGGELGRSH